MELSIYYLFGFLLALLILRITFLYLSDQNVFVILKSHIYNTTFPIIKIDSIGHLPWKDGDSFRLTIQTETTNVYFEYGSTAEALDKLSNKYIQPGEDLSIPVDGAECPVCGEMMNPLSGAEGFRNKTIGGVFTVREPVNICISCSKDLRRNMVQRGTPTHSTAEIVAGNWSELEADVDFL